MMNKNLNSATNAEIDVDKIIEQLLSVKETPGKQVFNQTFLTTLHVPSRMNGYRSNNKNIIILFFYYLNISLNNI